MASNGQDQDSTTHRGAAGKSMISVALNTIGLLLLTLLLVGLVVAIWATGLKLGAEFAPNTDAVAAMSGLLSTAFRLAIVLAAVWALMRLAQLLVKHRSLFGEDGRALLLGLLVATLLRPGDVATLVTAPAEFLLGVLDPYAIEITYGGGSSGDFRPGFAFSSSPIDESSSATEGVRASPLFAPLQNLIAEVAFTIRRAAQASLVRIYVPGLVVFFGVWMIVGQIASMTTRPEMQAGVRNSKALLLVIGTGFYLSIIAMISVPWFETEPLREELKYEVFLKAVDEVPEATAKPPQAPTAGDDLMPRLATADAQLTLTKKDLESLIKDEVLLDGVITHWNDAKAEARARVALQIKRRDMQRKVYEEQLEKVPKKIASARTKVLSSYQSSVQTIPKNVDRQQFYQTLLGWYQWEITGIQSDLERCREAVRVQTDDAEDLIGHLTAYTETRNRLGGWLQQRTRGLTLSDAERNYIVSEVQAPRIWLTSSNGSFYCIDSHYQSQPPPSPLPGQSWGVFGWLSQWLLTTRTIELCLLTGMIGFGLLGAALSFVVRTGPQEQLAQSGHFTAAVSVLLRGTSAAVVTYLLLRGGLAVISENHDKVNPYVLFAACLVAAVYSEEAWRRARDLLSKPDSGQGGGPGKTS